MLSLRSPKGLSPTGVGPLIFITVLPLLALAIAAKALWPERTGLPAWPMAPIVTLGVVGIAVGVGLWAWTLRRFLRGFVRGELVTDGPFALCRNPLYASLTLFLVPGLGLVLRTWTLLALTPLAAAWVCVLVQREEKDLARVFGAEWEAYARRTGRLLPRPPKRG